MQCKSDLRRAVVGKRNALGPAEIACRSACAAAHLFSLPEMEAAHTIMFFVTFGSEVDTMPMLRRALSEGKRVLAPRADPARRELTPCQIQDLERDLAPGAHDIREPAPCCPAVCLDEIDVVIVPASVWSEDGYRAGYGAGYYDRFLARLPAAVRIGLGLEVQVAPEVPHEPHDLPVDILVTETGIRRFGHRRRGKPHER
jgi:5-formyltetrahydrofolate cyclo-ligase